MKHEERFQGLDTNFFIVSRETGNLKRLLISLVKYLLKNPGFLYLIIEGIGLAVAHSQIILGGISIGVGSGGIMMYALIPYLDESEKNEGLNFYLYFCFLQGILFPFFFIFFILNKLKLEAVVSLFIFLLELAKILVWAKKAKRKKHNDGSNH